jgi:serine/threonine protein kinase/predicted ATPase
MDIVTCPATNQIVQLLRGQIPHPLATELTTHIKSCSRCSQSLELLGETEPTNASFVAAGAAVRASLLSKDLGSENSNPGGEQTNQLAFLAPALSTDEIGWLAHYRIFKVLGEGGMGIVLHAEDTQLKRAVALKVIKADFSQDQETRQRFLREARAMAQVKSDHVVTIYQVGQDNETCYIAMELLEGEPLNILLDRVVRPTVSEMLRIGREIAHALAAAHAKGLIHRDIKPENVWLEEPIGRVKLLDFGLARAHTVNVRLTSSGIIIGTPAYMAPEQARAEPLDERTDLFALGCLLYELATGRPPFYGESVTAILLALIGETPLPPSHSNPEIPAALDELILHLLAKSPADRPTSAQSVIARLESIEGKTASTYGQRPASTAGSIRSSERVNTPSAFSHSPGRLREAEHRQVTVLVCSCALFESEEYLERLDAEDQAKLLRDFQEACKQAVQRLDGTVVRWNEESLLACFGYPIAYEDAAPRAAHTALAILEALTAVGEQVRREHEVELGPWLGLHTGPAIVETKKDDVSLVGEARNIAVRLKDAARSGQIICTESTHRLLIGNFDCASLGEHKIKNLGQPVTLFQVQGAIEAGTLPNKAALLVERSPLIGRDQEMSLLKGRWEQAQEGMGQVVLLIGEAGLGKSRLVHDMKQHVRGMTNGAAPESSIRSSLPGNGRIDHDSPVVEWFCSPHFRNTGLYPASNFFQRILQFGRDDTPTERRDRLMRHLEKYDLALPGVVPLFASLLSLPSEAKFPSLELTPVREREEMFRALQDWLCAYSKEQPVLFIVEDLHWVDASTLEFLGQFLASGLNERVLTILTCRPEFQTPWPALPHQTSIALSRLTKAQVGDLMRKKTGSDLPQAVVDQVYERAGGVPLFIEEFTKMVQESGVCDQVGDSGARLRTLMSHAIPTTLQDLIMARLERMDGDREVAQLAATIGRNFSYELLAAVVDGDQSTLAGELTKLVQAEILFEKGRPPRSTYIFKHALLEDALYNALVKSKRQQFHGRIAEVLEARFPQIGETQPELLAHHFTEAGRIEKSIGYWLSAGSRSQEQFANVEAIDHLTKGLEQLSTLPESPDRDVNELALLNRLGSAYQAALGYAEPKVGPTFSRARELCRRTGHTSQLFAVMWGSWTWHLVRGDLDLCMEIADEMMAVARYSQDRGITMEAYAVPAVTHFYRGDFAACREHCEHAIAQYEDLEQCRIWSGNTGQNSAVVHRCYLSLALWHLGYPDQALRMNEEAVALARQVAHPFSLAHALHFAGWLNQYCRLGDQTRAAASEEIAVAAEQGFALWRATGTFLEGAGIFLQGELAEALPRLEKGVQAFRAISAVLTLPAQLCVLAEAYMKSGRLVEADQALEEGLALVEKHQDHSQEAELYRLKGELVLLQSGDQSAAEGCFRQAIETAHRQQSRAWELRSTVSLARLQQEQGRREEARTALAIICGAYTEGSTPPDLVAANELLKSL